MRFYENRFIRPLPVFIVSVILSVSNPLNLPPTPKAEAVEVVIEPVLVERTPDAAQAYAKTQLDKFGWDSPKQWACLEELWTGESNWRPNAYNKKAVYQNGERLHAGGIPQILGLDPDTTVEYQIERGLTYIDSRYSTPCGAMYFWSKNYWY
jgi:hypothetical protein